MAAPSSNAPLWVPLGPLFRRSRRGDGDGVDRAVPAKPRAKVPAGAVAMLLRRYRRGNPALALHVDRRPVLRPVLRVRLHRCTPGAVWRTRRLAAAGAAMALLAAISGLARIAGTAIGRQGTVRYP